MSRARAAARKSTKTVTAPAPETSKGIANMKIILPLLLLFSLAGAGESAILPSNIGPWKQLSEGPLEVKTGRQLWDEYGLQDSVQAAYQNAGKSMTVQAWRLSDSTASMGAFDYLRPADARRDPKFDDLTPNMAVTPSGGLVALGNYLVRFGGSVPDPDSVANMFRSMSRYEHSMLPTFTGYLPGGMVPNSDRYVSGPVALQSFFPGIEPSVAGFHLGAEAAVAEYKPDLKLALFSYPTPYIARNREAELAKIPGAIVKRTGPLVAIVLHPADTNKAEQLLAQVRYQAVVTTGEKPATPKDNPGNFMLNVFYLIAILFGFCLASGLLFGGLRMIFRRSSSSGDEEEILALHLEGR